MTRVPPTRAGLAIAVALACCGVAGPAAASPPNPPSVQFPDAVAAPGYPGLKTGISLRLRAGIDASTVKVRYRVLGTTSQQEYETTTGPNFEIVIPDLGAAPLNIADGGTVGVIAYAFNAAGETSLESYPAALVQLDSSASVRFVPPQQIVPAAPIASYANPPPNRPVSTSDVVLDLVAFGASTDIRCVQWRVDSGDPSAFVPALPPSPATPCANPPGDVSEDAPLPGGLGVYSGEQIRLTGLAEGGHTIDVRVRDALGNAGTVSRFFSLDRTAPELALTYESFENGLLQRTSAGFGFTTSDPPFGSLYPIVRLFCGLDVPALLNTDECNSSSNRSHTEGGITEGPHSLLVQAVDLAGNQRQLVRTFTASFAAAPDEETPSGFVPTTRITPSAKKVCTSRRSFRIRVKKIRKRYGASVVSAIVYVNGQKKTTRKGKRITAIVNLRGLKKGTYRVVIKMKLSNGRTIRDVRTYRTCIPKTIVKKKQAKKKSTKK